MSVALLNGDRSMSGSGADADDHQFRLREAGDRVRRGLEFRLSSFGRASGAAHDLAVDSRPEIIVQQDAGGSLVVIGE